MASTKDNNIKPSSFPSQQLVQLRVSSPYLKNPPPNDDVATTTTTTTTNNESNRREFRKSLERIERINMNDLEPFKQSRPDTAELVGFSKRQHRLSREILGVDDPVLSAPDNAPNSNSQLFQLQQKSQEKSKESDEDASSIVMAGSIASTVPDRYGFVGGNQYTHDTDK